MAKVRNWQVKGCEYARVTEGMRIRASVDRVIMVGDYLSVAATA